ncbi:hypothetical protein BC629DRAFT_994389 [Irpex lacteus]|nr:hypothetical protein BC629DRAFT_994389 [Irpex lacteus]
MDDESHRAASLRRNLDAQHTKGRSFQYPSSLFCAVFGRCEFGHYPDTIRVAGPAVCSLGGSCLKTVTLLLMLLAWKRYGITTRVTESPDEAGVSLSTSYDCIRNVHIRFQEPSWRMLFNLAYYVSVFDLLCAISSSVLDKDLSLSG